MTDTAEEQDQIFDPRIRTPEMEMAERGAGVAAAADLALEDINPVNPHLFKEDRWQEHFARLRAEDPVHFNEIETAGRYWSITRYDDVRAVDGDWHTFSSAKGITLGSAGKPPGRGPGRAAAVVHLHGPARPTPSSARPSGRCRRRATCATSNR